MSTVVAPNVVVVGVEGTSDDLDIPIRNVFQDTAFSAAHKIMSANSINVARILIQSGERFPRCAVSPSRFRSTKHGDVGNRQCDAM